VLGGGRAWGGGAEGSCVTENCRLIIAFFPQRPGALSPAAVERLLAGHPVRLDRIEVTEKGILVFAQSTQCDSMDLTVLREALFQEAQKLGFRVRLQREDLFRAMHSLVLSS
jgi:predicted amino acid-binding ACT domain protein